MSLYPFSQLDGNQILQGSYDDANQLIRTSATVLFPPGGATVNQGTTPWIVSGTVSATQSGTWNINNISGTISLPTNAAAESGGNLAFINLKLPNGLTVTSNRLLVDGSGVVQPVSGTLTVNQGTSPWVTSATQSGTWTVQQGTPPWSVSQSGTWNINNISGTISLPTGAATSANQTTANTSLATIVTNTNNITVAQGSTTSGQTGQLIQGAVTTSAPSYSNAQTDPLSLTTSGALRVDNSATFSSSTSTVTSVASSATNVSLLSSNTARKGASFYNDSTQNCYVKLGTTASVTSYTVQMIPNSFFVVNNDPVYTGEIDGIWVSANGNMRITELT